MERQNELTFIKELTALIKQPKTLRSMKYTTWSNTTEHKQYEFNDCYIMPKTENSDEFNELINELGKCVSNGGDMSEELLNKFIFSGDFCELLYAEKQKNEYKPRPSGYCEEEWSAELKKLRESVDNNINKMSVLFEEALKSKKEKYNNEREYEYLKRQSGDRDCRWYSEKRTKEENAKRYEEIILRQQRTIEESENKLKENIEKYNEIQNIIVERYGIKSMTFEEREQAEIKYIYLVYSNKIYEYKHLITKSGFVKLIKRLSNKIQTLKIGEESVVDLYFKHKEKGNDFESITKYAPYKKSGLQLKTFITQENVFKKKGIEINDNTRDENNTLYVPKMFNIISKRNKLYTEGIKGLNDNKSDEYKPFDPFEKCGVEVVYVRLGYKSDGTKQGNKNKGSLECLKNAYKDNMCGYEWNEKKKEYVKIKGAKMPTKKDELTQILYKV